MIGKHHEVSTSKGKSVNFGVVTIHLVDEARFIYNRYMPGKQELQCCKMGENLSNTSLINHP